MLPEPSPAQALIARRGVPIGAGLLLVFGAIGLYSDSTFAGLLAGAGLAILLASLALRR
jgi:hypothetical protein